MPFEKYIDHSFNSGTTKLIDYANHLIAQYAKMRLTLTLRQLYYRFVAAGKLPNTQQSYKRLGKVVNDARLAGLIDWAAIEDRTRALEGRTRYGHYSELLRNVPGNYHTDWWKDQDTRVEIWVEKEALVGVVQRAAFELDCDFFACRGYVSQSEMWEAHKRMQKRGRHQKTVILHLGDHDPSGIDMTRDVESRLVAVFRNRSVRVDRIALNWDQIEQYSPPPNPAKSTDSRFEEYEATYGEDSWELDALEPKVIITLVQAKIREHITNPAAFAAAQAHDKEVQAWLTAKLSNL